LRVVLVGMMGSGKSTIGCELSKITGWPYHDNDALLAQGTAATAKQLLSNDGVTELRAGEAGALELGLAQPEPSIIGAPAGTIMDARLCDLMKRDALVVWLTASPQALARRARGAAHRPWLGGDAEAWMTTTLAQRAPLYEALADLTVNTERRRPHAVAQQIADWIAERDA
jgi:shikimate kinase